MATTTVVLFLLLLSFPASPLSVTTANTAGDARIKAACQGTPYLDTSVAALSQYKDPRSTYADAVALAKLEVEAASTTAAGLVFDGENMSKADVDCFKECQAKLDRACKALDPYEGKIKLDKVRSFIADAKAKRVEWNCEVCQHGDDKKKIDRISKGNDAEKFMEMLPLLLDHTLPDKS